MIKCDNCLNEIDEESPSTEYCLECHEAFKTENEDINFRMYYEDLD